MTLAQNLIREFKEIKKESFRREEVIDIINSITSSHQKNDLESNGIIVSPERHLVYINGKWECLPKKVFEIIYYFIENKNKSLLRENMLRDIWGTDVYIGHRTIDVHIRKIRVLGIDCIKTLKNAYRWEEK
jgi:two-component system alkaline phosphatase synthesis response regulator PhoP